MWSVALGLILDSDWSVAQVYTSELIPRLNSGRLHLSAFLRLDFCLIVNTVCVSVSAEAGSDSVNRGSYFASGYIEVSLCSDLR